TRLQADLEIDDGRVPVGPDIDAANDDENRAVAGLAVLDDVTREARADTGDRVNHHGWQRDQARIERRGGEKSLPLVDLESLVRRDRDLLVAADLEQLEIGRQFGGGQDLRAGGLPVGPDRLVVDEDLYGLGLAVRGRVFGRAVGGGLHELLSFPPSANGWA